MFANDDDLFAILQHVDSNNTNDQIQFEVSLFGEFLAVITGIDGQTILTYESLKHLVTCSLVSDMCLSRESTVKYRIQWG